MATLKIAELAVYPVKSLRGISLPRMTFDAFGPAGDRRYVVVDRKGRFVTQRDYSKMALVQVAVCGDALNFSAPSMPAFALTPRIASDTLRRDVIVWRDTVSASDMGDEVASWLSSYLGTEVRLCFMPEDSVRAVDPQYGRAGDRVSFADGFPVLLIGAASLEALNHALPQPITSARFRPNIVVAGAEPYAEDSWRRIRVGAIEFDVVKPCSRCVIPSIDLDTAQRQAVVAQTLARLRRRDNAVYFGQNLIARGCGEIAVGDEVVVLA